MNNSDSSLIFNNTAYIVILKALIPKFKLFIGSNKKFEHDNYVLRRCQSCQPIYL